MITEQKRGVLSTVRTVVGGVALAALFAVGAERAIAQTEDADDALYADSYVGAASDDLFVGVMIADHPPEPDRKAVIVYLCDGEEVSTWLFGEAIGDSVVVADGDTQVELSLGDTGVAGVLERAGEAPRLVVLEPAMGDAGLYRSVQSIGGDDYVGGWIVLNDGRQRGAITLDGEVVDNPALDPVTGQAESAVGTFGTNCFRDPRTGDRICRYRQLN